MTSVECSWDQADEDRERKLTSYHKWHEMDEEELAKYLASSSEDEGEEEEEKGKSHNNKKKKKPRGKEKKRKQTRALLLEGLVEGELHQMDIV